MDNHLTFGKHKGTVITRVPLSYLRFMINAGTPQADLAKDELSRRGDTLPLVEISGHAIDNASLRVLYIWKDYQGPDEQDKGLYSWLQQMTLEAIQANNVVDGKYKYKGMKLVIEEGEEFPVLKTIMQ